MIAELGHAALALALPLLLAQGLLPLLGANRRDLRLMALGDSLATAVFLLAALSFAALTHAYVVSDFSVIGVYENSHTDKPLLYRITGVWGNHEGSLLLWVLVLALFAALVAWFGRTLPETLKARVLAVMGWIGAGFLAFLLFTSNPFLRLDPPPEQGMGLNPLLQDPGLAFHPPMLYLGYVGLSVTYAFAVAALLEGRVDAAWARWVRPWTLAAWTFLTLGIALGSWWAYYELGWGGWWFWDPVENASFIPWLVATALLHSAIVAEKRDALRRWTVLLAIAGFGCSLLGTFLVRSGVITSVHAFASDPTRGVFILLLLVAALGGALVLYAVRAPRMGGGGLFAPISREGALLLNNLFLAAAAGTVLLGTLYPLLIEGLDLPPVSVGAPFYNAVFVPLMAPLVVLMGVGPLLGWKRGDLGAVAARLWWAGIAAGAVAVAMLWREGGGVALGFGLAVWLALATLVEWAERVRLLRVPLGDSLRRAAHLPRAAHGMSLAHLGMAVLIAGITGSSLMKQEASIAARPGTTLEIAGYSLVFQGVTETDGPNYRVLRGMVEVRQAGVPLATLAPEKRAYASPPMATTEAAIRTTGLSDLYVVIGEADGDGVVLRAFHEPLVPLLWYGTLLMGLGGLVSLSDRRGRVGAPTRARGAALPA